PALTLLSLHAALPICSRLSAFLTAAARRGDDRVLRLRRLVVALRAAFPRRFTGIPARRALERPIAIACLAERAPCLPSRTCPIRSEEHTSELQSRFDL